MIVFRRILTGLRPPVAARPTRTETRRPSPRSLSPRLETLESIELLSGGFSAAALARHRPAAPVPAQVQAEVVPFTNHTAARPAITAATVTQLSTTVTQTATVPNTLTNFSQPFAPPIALFDPALGRLVAVHVTATANLVSQITSQNLSNNTPATITGTVAGNFVISGLQPGSATLSGPLQAASTPITVTANAGDPNFGGTSTAKFPALTATKTNTLDFTTPADLSFFTAGPSRTTITPVLVENAQAGASAPNGNLQTNVLTNGSGSLRVTYDYVAQCPAVTRLLRFGIHHQPTQLYVTFAGPLSAADAANPAFYNVVVSNRRGSFTGPGTGSVAVTAAAYDPATFTVRLDTARQLNVHQIFQLVISLPCTNGTPTVIEFGGKRSLGGFTSHQGTLVQVVNGKIVG